MPALRRHAGYAAMAGWLAKLAAAAPPGPACGAAQGQGSQVLPGIQALLDCTGRAVRKWRELLSGVSGLPLHTLQQCRDAVCKPATAASSSSKTKRHQCWLAATHLRGHPAPGWPRRQSAAGTLHTPPRPRCAGTPPAGQGGEKLLRLAGGRRQRRAGREAAAHREEVSLRHHLALVRHAVELTCPTGLPWPPGK
jgi:hypothetical protein